MENQASSKSEIAQLGKAVANTSLLVLIVLASVGLPLLGLEGLFAHAHGGEEGVILLIKRTYWTIHAFGVTLLTNPLYYAGFPALLALQLLRPASSVNACRCGLWRLT
jgi:hypothetical protein